MSDMAARMAQQMRDDGIDPSGAGDQVPMVEVPPVETPGGVTGSRGAAATGSEGRGTAAPPVPPPAEALNTDRGDGEPGPVPYARFREVNDQLRELKDLEDYRQFKEYGYDPDSLGRLAAFEAQYLRSPKETIALLIGDQDLPEEAKSAIIQHLGVQDPSVTPPAGAGDEQSGDGQAPPLSKEDRELLNWAKERREQEAREMQNAQSNAQLAAVVNAWTEMDKKDGLHGENAVPDRIKYRYIASAFSSGAQFRTFDQAAEAARREFLEEQDIMLRTAVRGGRNGGSLPPSLPGGAAPPAPARVEGLKTFADANKLVHAALTEGRLPPMNPEG